MCEGTTFWSAGQLTDKLGVIGDNIICIILDSMYRCDVMDYVYTQHKIDENRGTVSAIEFNVSGN